MAVGNSSFIPKDIQISYAKTPRVRNIVLTNKFQEYQIDFVTNCKQIILSARNLAKIQYCFEAGKSNIEYKTLHRGISLNLDQIDFISVSIFLQSDLDLTIIELLELF